MAKLFWKAWSLLAAAPVPERGGSLYAITSDGDVWSLNAATAVGTYLGATGLTDVSGLSALRPVPEPSTLGLLGLCLAGLALGRRRRKN